MHRRVAQTVAALPHRASQRLWDPDSELEIAPQHTASGHGSHGVSTPGQRPTLNSNYNVDPHSSIDVGILPSQQMSSSNDCIASDGDPRLSSSPVSIHYDSTITTMLQQDVVQPENDEQLDDEFDDIEWELQNNGLYVGSYSRAILFNAFVPFFAVLIFTVLALLPDLVWPIATSPSRYPKLFPSPLPEILLSSAFFSLAHLFRVPLYSTVCLLLPPEYASLASILLHVLLTNGFRLAALAILQVKHTMDYPSPTFQDPVFRTVWWFSLNFAEVVVAIVQGYEQLALYREVMVPEGRETEFLELLKAGSSTHLPEDGAFTPEEASEHALEGGEGPRSVDTQIDRGLEKLLVIKTREELEEVYGLPFIKIPVFISCLQRFNSIVLSVGLNLLLSSAYLRSPLSLPESDQVRAKPHDSSHMPFVVTLPLVILLHASLAVLHSPAVLPRIGVHTAAYVGVLVGIMSFFAGLAVWGALS